jgi:hypothetical protein
MPEKKRNIVDHRSLWSFIVSGAHYHLTPASIKLQRIADYLHYMSFYLPKVHHGFKISLLRQDPALVFERYSVLIGLC